MNESSLQSKAAGFLRKVFRKTVEAPEPGTEQVPASVEPVAPTEPTTPAEPTN